MRPSIQRTIQCASLVIPLLLASGPTLAGGATAQGNRLALVTYWGEDKVALVDTKGEKGKEEIWVIDTFKAAGCSKPYDVRSDKKGAHAFVSCSGGDQIAVIDVVAQQVEYTITSGKSPRDLQLFDNDTRLVAANSGEDTISVIDVVNRRVLYKVDVILQPYGVAITDDEKLALITGWASGDLHFIKLGETSGTEIGVVPVGILPYTVIVPKGQRIAYVAANGSHSVAAVDIDSMKLLQSIRVGRNPWSLSANPDGTKILVANNRSSTVSVLQSDGRAGSVMTEAKQIGIGTAGRGPDDLAVSGAAKNVAFAADGVNAAVTDLANNQLVMIATDSSTVTRRINVGRAPYGIEFLR